MVQKSQHEVFSTKSIVAIQHVGLSSKWDYTFLKKIVVKRQDERDYAFSEADFENLSINDIEDMYLAKVQGRMRQFPTEVQREFIKSLLIFIRRIVIKERVEDLQLAVESYQKRVNFTPPQLDLPDINQLSQLKLISKPFGVVYRSELQRNCLMACRDLHKFGDHTLKMVRDGLAYRLKDIRQKIGSPKRWNSQERRDVKRIITQIDERLYRRDQFRTLESFVGGRPRINITGYQRPDRTPGKIAGLSESTGNP